MEPSRYAGRVAPGDQEGSALHDTLEMVALDVKRPALAAGATRATNEVVRAAACMMCGVGWGWRWSCAKHTPAHRNQRSTARELHPRVQHPIRQHHLNPVRCS